MEKESSCELSLTLPISSPPPLHRSDNPGIMNNQLSPAIPPAFSQPKGFARLAQQQILFSAPHPHPPNSRASLRFVWP